MLGERMVVVFSKMAVHANSGYLEVIPKVVVITYRGADSREVVG